MRAIDAFKVAAILILAGCSESSAPFSRNPHLLSPASRQILDTSNEFVLYSLEPTVPAPSTDTREKFHIFPILGRAEIKDAKEKSELLSAMYKGIADSDGRAAACFNPRHGIRAVSANWVELVICFECGYMQEWGSGAGDGATTTKSPTETFNQALRKAGLPLSTK